MEKARLGNQINSNKFGASMVEYALLLVLIALTLVAVITSLGQGLQKPFSEVASIL